MKRPDTNRPKTIEEAVLTEDPLMAIEALIDQESSGSQWFRLMFSAILEVNSAGPGILFDRFAFSEVKNMASEYAQIGAEEFPKALCELIDYAVVQFGHDPTEEQLTTLMDNPTFKALDRKHALKFETYRDEMEKALIAYIVLHPNAVQIRT